MVGSIGKAGSLKLSAGISSEYSGLSSDIAEISSTALTLNNLLSDKESNQSRLMAQSAFIGL